MRKITLLFFAVLMTAFSWQGMAQAGSTCGDPLVVPSLPFTDSGNTSDYGDNYSSSDIPAVAPGAVTNGSSHTFYLNGDEAVYAYTPSISQLLSVTAEGVVAYSGMFAFTGCSFDSTVGYHVNGFAGGDLEIEGLPVIGGQTYYFVISTWASPQSTPYTIEIIDVTPSCIAPTALATTDITTTTADIEWTAGATETAWNISWGTPGYEPGDGDEIDTASVNNDTEYQITNLIADAAYDVYVQADCGATDGVSAWVGPLSITTSCGVMTVPYSLTFEEGANCATIENAGSGNNWGLVMGSSSGFDGIYARYLYHSSNAANAWLYTAEIALEAGVNYQISYKYGASNYTEKMKVAYGIENIATSMTTELADHPNITGSTPNHNTVYFTVPANGTYYFGFNAYSDANQNTLYLDDIEITLAPSCIPPTALATTDISTTTADIEWVTGATETAWNISWGTPGYEPGDTDEIDTAVVNNNAAYQITGLTADTHYDVYVQADCDADGMSTWAGPLEVFTGYCEVSTSWGDYLSSISSVGAVTDFTYSATTQPAGGYANETQQGFEAYETQSFDINTTFNGGSNGVKVWVDWNNDLEFDASEEMAYEVGTDASKTLSITVLAGTPQGDYRMRIRGQFGSSANPPPCGNVSYGSTVDFTLTIVDPPSCIAPTALTTTNISTTTTDIEWTAGGSETAWNISWGTPGYEPGDTDELGTDVASATSYQITGLTAQTDYDVYVQADCGGTDGVSNWIGPVSFTTFCEPIAIPYTEDFDSYGTGSEAFPDCWTRPVTNFAVSTTWPSIVGRSGTSSAPNALQFRSLIDTPTYAVSPAFAEDINDLRVSFMLRREGTNSGTIDVGVMSDASDISTFELVATIDPSDNNFNEYIFDLNQVNLSGSDNFIAFRHNSNLATWFYWLDDFEVDFIPSCPAPTALATTSISTTTADIEWVAGATETAWNISWGTPGYTPGDTDEIDTASVNNDAEYQITGLTAQTDYDVYVQADCVEQMV